MWLVLLCFAIVVVALEPTWKSLDSRPIPPWYDEAKFGIMLHFGVYSATIGSEWFWKDWKRGHPGLTAHVTLTKPPNFSYQEYANDFKAELFDPDEWADIFADAGARYVVVTAKHHDGFTLYPSSYSPNWNSVDVGPHFDILNELADSIKVHKGSMRFGIYYSLMEWFHPLYLKDRKESTKHFVDHKMLPELKEIVELYLPDIVWSDGDWDMTDEYWKSKEFLVWLFTNSSVKEDVVVNDRWGTGIMCKHGSFLTCKDRYNPGIIQNKKFENALSLDTSSWGFDSMTRLDDILSTKKLIRELVTTVACNGNLLLNVGPNSAGRISNIYAERLLEIGKWLKVNGEGIYGSRPWVKANEGKDIWFTVNKKNRLLYVFVLEYPFESNMIVIKNVTQFTSESPKISLVGFADTTINVSCIIITMTPTDNN